MLKRFIPISLHPFYFMMAGSLFFYAIGYLLAFITSILITRHLGAGGRGLVTSITSLIGIAAVISQLGMSQVNKKLAAENKELAGTLFLITIIICLVASVIVVPSIYWLGRNQDFLKGNYQIFLTALAVMPLLSISGSCAEILVGMHFNKEYNSLFIAEKLSFAILIITMIMAGHLNAATALISFYISQILKIILCGFFLRKYLSFRLIKRATMPKLDKGMIASNYLSLICLNLAYSMLPILLSHFSGLNDVGYFAGSRSIIDTIMVLPMLYSSYSINKLTVERKTGNYKETRRLLIIILLIIMAIAAVFFYCISSMLIPLMFGQPFAMAVPCFNHMLPGVIFLAGYQIMNSVLLVERKLKSLLFLSVIYVLSITMLPFIISSRIDAVTAADTYSISCLLTFLMAGFFTIKFKVD